jgi:hypothetical protein
MISRCSSEERGYFGESHLCERLVDETGLHRGYHQQITGGPGYSYGRQWSDDGSWSLGREHDTVCGSCGSLVKPDQIEDGICDRCLSWMHARAGYLAGTDIVIGGTLYRRGRQTGAFGDSPTHIILDDGREYQDTRTWHIGTVPQQFRDLWPDNARFVREGRSYPIGSPLDAWATDEERSNAS